MKTRLLLLLTLLCLSGCSLFSQPTRTARDFVDSAVKVDVDAMTDLFSSMAKEKYGLGELRANSQRFAERIQRGVKAGGAYRLEIAEVTSIPTGQRVVLVCRNEADFFHFDFDLSKEGRKWKIDAIGGPKLEELWALGTPEANNPPAANAPYSFPEPPETPRPETKSDFKGTTISGGVLNGKAISLPKPPYPPIAKAAKAHGTVVVEVLVDEDGNVVNAEATSGHPLLRAACVAAARAAKFSPTKLAGQPVKVSGVINYFFDSPQ